MRMMVASRIFGIQIEGHKTDAFVAYADMLNHRRPRQTSWWYDDGREGFVIESLEEIKRGDQIYDSYGKKCNTRFLLNYGFINLNNDGNEYPYKLTVSEEDPLCQAKKDLLGQESFKRSYRTMTDLTEDTTIKMMSFLRFSEWDGDMMILAQAKMRDEKFKQQAKQNLDSDSDDCSVHAYKAENLPVLSIKNETRVLEKLKSLSKEYLGWYPHSLSDDEEALRQDDEGMTEMTFNQRNSVLFRQGEKEILHWFIRFADFVQNMLTMKFKEAKKETQILPKEFESARDYLQTAIIPLILKE